MDIYSFTVPTIEQQDATLEAFRGQVLLIVNTASGCGLAPQFEGLEALYQAFHTQGFSVLGFPCNQFANQEPLSAKEAQASCQLHYHVTFPMFGKVTVNGTDTLPLFDFLKKETGGILSDAIKWNFTKFLVDRTGRVVKRYAPTTEPKAIQADIEKLLAQSI